MLVVLVTEPVPKEDEFKALLTAVEFRLFLIDDAVDIEDGAVEDVFDATDIAEEVATTLPEAVDC